MAFESLLESAAEKLTGNERLRSHLTDEEFNPCLEWALDYLTQAVAKAKDKEAAQKILAKELPVVEQTLKVINDALKEGKKLTLETAATPLNLKVPKQVGEFKDRVALVHAILNLLKEKK